MNTAWIIALLVDLGFQVNRHFFVLRVRELRCDPLPKIYMFFLVWRFSKRMEHYSSVQTEEEEGKYGQWYQFFGKLTWDAGKY